MAKIGEFVIRMLLFVVFYSVTFALIGQVQDFKLMLLFSFAGFVISYVLTKIVVRMIRGGGRA